MKLLILAALIYTSFIAGSAAISAAQSIKAQHVAQYNAADF